MMKLETMGQHYGSNAPVREAAKRRLREFEAELQAKNAVPDSRNPRVLRSWMDWRFGPASAGRPTRPANTSTTRAPSGGAPSRAPGSGRVYRAVVSGMLRDGTRTMTGFLGSSQAEADEAARAYRLNHQGGVSRRAFDENGNLL
jgi:hypothetical protein